MSTPWKQSRLHPSKLVSNLPSGSSSDERFIHLRNFPYPRVEEAATLAPMRAAIVFCSSVLAVVLIEGEAAAVKVPYRGCAVASCGFAPDPALTCSVVPADHPITMDVLCHLNIPEGAFPVLMDEAGRVIASEWEKKDENLIAEMHTYYTQVYYALPSAHYELRSPPLEEGVLYQLRAAVPPGCPVAVWPTSDGLTALCESPLAPAEGCCGDAESGTSFRQGDPLHPDPETDSGLNPNATRVHSSMGGQGGAPNWGADFYEIASFVAGPPNEGFDYRGVEGCEYPPPFELGFDPCNPPSPPMQRGTGGDLSISLDPDVPPKELEPSVGGGTPMENGPVRAKRYSSGCACEIAGRNLPGQPSLWFLALVIASLRRHRTSF